MAGPALALRFILLVAFFGLILFLFIYAIRKRYSPKKSIPAGLLFLGLTTFSIYTYWKIKRSEYETSKKFLGDYKLSRLDKQNCENCKVRLKDGYTYDILVNDKVVGQGKWHIGTAVDIPGTFLKIDNGPTWVIWESDRLIEYINRTQDR
jgi:hypothetical protein